jgi:hypothetical protein
MSAMRLPTAADESRRFGLKTTNKPAALMNRKFENKLTERKRMNHQRIPSVDPVTAVGGLTAEREYHARRIE